MQNRYIIHVIQFFFMIPAFIALTVSCFTVRYSTKLTSIPVEAKTVSVQYFQNQANYIEPGFAQQLTDALKDYIQSNTDLVIVNDIGDLDFEGTIKLFETKPMAIVSGDVASQNRFTIAIEMKFTSYVTSDQDFNVSFSRYEDYDSNLDFEDVKTDLTEDIQELLIEEIFNRAFSNW